MPKYTETQEDHLRKIIRDATAIDPTITVRALQGVTEKKIGRPLSLEYIIKLQRKVRGEVKIRPDRERYEDRLAHLRERNRIVVEELFRIAFPDPKTPAMQMPSIMDRRKSLESISRIERDMIKLEMDLGLFTRHLGTIDVDHRLKPMDESTLIDVIQTFKAWSTPPQMRRIEPIRIITAQTKELPNGPDKPTATASQSPIQPIPVTTGAGLVTAE